MTNVILPRPADNADPLDEKATASAHLRGRLAANQILIGRFVIVRFIAKGDVGEVYEATDIRLGRSVALKFLPEKSRPASASLKAFPNARRRPRRP